ncbi:phosphatidate cytidylyltransferase [uncultured Algibacter sp.]|uniref:phosphatidate cytidylyltransferase n=1 Tax=uncultured Algibacter sp. TaxID=298659 RepID=UPI003216B2B1
MKLNNNSENKYADVPLRVKTWVFIILIFSLGVSQTITMAIFVSWIGFQVFLEFYRMFQLKGKGAIFSTIVGITQFCLLYFFNIKNYFSYTLIFSLVVILFFIIKKETLKKILGIAIGLILGVFIFPYLFFLRESTWGLKTLIFLVVITELNDVFQYLMGKSLGKHKIASKISPNKTREGLVGGVFLTIILSNLLGYFLLPSSIFINTLLGIILGVLGFFGDIFMSFIKRKTNVKDTGKLLPGHGGLLDRMDSLIFNAPIFFWILPLLFKS